MRAGPAGVWTATTPPEFHDLGGTTEPPLEALGLRQSGCACQAQARISCEIHC